MIEFIKNNENGTIVYKNNAKYEERYTCLTFIKKLCIKHLFTYEGYKKSVSLVLNKRNLLPLVLSSELVLIPIKRTKNYDNIWINLKSVKKVIGIKEGILVTFYSNKEIELNISLVFYFKQVELANIIENEKRKHFH